MPTLLEIQTIFRNALLGPDAAEAAVADAAAHVVADGVEAAARLQIHRNHIFLTLTDALAGIYPAVEAMVGGEFFRAMAHRYIGANPPGEPSLYAFGGGLADFIATFAPAASLPYLPDLARLEWAMHASFHAPDEPALTAEALARVPPERLAGLALRLRADARVLHSRWPLGALWQAARAGDADSAAAVDLAQGAAWWLVLRQDGDVRFWQVPPGEGRWLAACAAGAGLEAAADAAQAADPAFDLATVLSANLQRGAFAAFSTTEPQSS